MSEEHLLTDLCKICNNNIPKYCCPRCKSKTCSLECCKRHKVWSQCSGKRDPGAYVKRNQLATAAGIDHDYNFLTSIERAFDTADRHADDRGISLRGPSSREPASGSNFQKNLQACGVSVHRAPKGMSRQRDNHTKWHPKHKCINWTVEWFHPDLTRQFGTCRENLALATAYSSLENNSHPQKKRKLSVDQSGSAQNARLKIVTEACTLTKTEETLEETDTASMSTDPASGDALIDAGNEQPNIVTPSHPAQEMEPTTNEQIQTSPQPMTSTEDLYFYLAKPLTSSLTRVLIPLRSDSTFSTCLRGQVVLEFPTIQVLKHPPTALPDGFQLERDYVEQTRKTIQELDEELGDLSAYADAAATRPALTGKEEDAFQDSKVLESLQRDLDVVRRYAM